MMVKKEYEILLKTCSDCSKTSKIQFQKSYSGKISGCICGPSTDTTSVLTKCARFVIFFALNLDRLAVVFKS